MKTLIQIDLTNGESITDEVEGRVDFIMEEVLDYLNKGTDFAVIGWWIIRTRDIRYIAFAEKV